MKLFQSTCREAGMIQAEMVNWVQFLEAPPPKKNLGGLKNRPKFYAISDKFRI